MPAPTQTFAPRLVRNRRGFTLVEVMVALVILTVATVMLGSSMAGSVASVQASRLDLAAALAQLDRVEAIRTSILDSCPPASSGNRPLPSGLSEHWNLRRGGSSLLVVDSLLWPPDRGGMSRVLTTELGCP